MALFEIHVDLARVADSLEKLVYLLEKLVLPVPKEEIQVHQAQLEDLRVVSPEDVDRIGQEQSDFAERFRVVPGSDAFYRELMAWEEEQRNIHGEEWKAPDWSEAFTAAQRSVREPSRPAGAAAQRGGAEVPETSPG